MPGCVLLLSADAEQDEAGLSLSLSADTRPPRESVQIRSGGGVQQEEEEEEEEEEDDSTEFSIRGGGSSLKFSR
jgi:hypothetical protein